VTSRCRHAGGKPRAGTPAGKRVHGRGQGDRSPALSILAVSTHWHSIDFVERRGTECRAERGKAGHTAISLSKGSPSPKATSNPREGRSPVWPQERGRRLVAWPERASESVQGLSSSPAPRQATTGVCTADVRAPEPQRRLGSHSPWRWEHPLQEQRRRPEWLPAVASKAADPFSLPRDRRRRETGGRFGPHGRRSYRAPLPHPLGERLPGQS
jgi:hypothetical protein